MDEAIAWRPRRTLVVQEDVHAEGGRALTRPLRRIAVVALVENPLAGRYVEDLSALFALGRLAGEALARQGLAVLGGAPAESYGKAVVVGLAGELEHAAAILHVGFVPALRQVLPSRSLMPASKRVGPPGAEITIPLGHLADAWSPAHWDAMHLAIPDGPRADELAIILALATGGRPHYRVGDHRPVSAAGP